MIMNAKMAMPDVQRRDQARSGRRGRSSRRRRRSVFRLQHPLRILQTLNGVIVVGFYL